MIIWLQTLKKETAMIKKKIINLDRIRQIKGGFGFIPHRFLSDGFLTSLNQLELLLYFFLILAADQNGLSYYSYEKICRLLGIDLDEYLEARDGLLMKDLIAFDNTVFQVLELPSRPKNNIGSLIEKSFKEA